MSRILLIRMLELGDIASIALPAIRYLKLQYPESQVEILTHGQGAEVIKLAEPHIRIHGLENGVWPDDILHAMEAFLGVAENIIGHSFSKIINLDTAFMPCFVARFLKDAGEPVEGNMLSISVQQLIDQVQSQTLQPEFVQDPQQYMQSSYFGMIKWHTPWWEGNVLPDMGYPEFYLKACCGWSEMEFDGRINLPSNNKRESAEKTIALSLASPQNRYPEEDLLSKLLEEKGFKVYKIQDTQSIQQQLTMLGKSDLLVTLPLAAFAFAQAVGCPTLLLSGQLDPRMLMPDYATDMADELPDAKSLSQSIESIFI